MAENLEARECLTANCGKPAKLQCPTCIKLNIKESFFCSQECFKESWDAHKIVHKHARHEQQHQHHHDHCCYDPWPGYEFTGLLRPYPQSQKREVPAHIQRPDYAFHPTGESLEERSAKNSSVIKVLDDEEIEGLKVACKLGREVLDVAAKAAGVGVTADEIDRLVHEACIERECYPSPLGYYGFPKSCCTSVNEVICHGIPDMRPLQNGDLLNVDITVYHRGFHGDLNETFFIGEVDDVAKNLTRVTHESLMQAIEIVKPGTRYREIGNVIQKHANANNFSVVRSFCGHGIHRLFHTAPNVPHYAMPWYEAWAWYAAEWILGIENKTMGVMKAGHSFTIEPMINEGGWQDVVWPDDWTAVTRDGKRSAQFEHTLLVTDTGCEILTLRKERNGQPWFMDSLTQG